MTPVLTRLLAIAACAIGALLHGTAGAEPVTTSSAPSTAAPVACPPAAAAPTQAQLQAGAKAARNHGFLWRIRKDGRESWLYGTMHVARFEWAFPGPAIASALQAADTLALEIDPLDPELQQRLANGMAAPSAAAALPRALQQRIRRLAELDCVPYDAIARFSPEMQVATLTSLVGRRDGLDPSFGIDVVLAGFARAASKPVVSLESIESQLASIAAPTPAEMIEFVDSGLTELESGRAAPALRRIAQVWADGDLPTLARFESWCDCVKTPADRAAMARLLDERNPALADRIAALHTKGQRVFAAVGSLHMVGPLGLPGLMAQRGFTVEAIPFPAR